MIRITPEYLVSVVHTLWKNEYYHAYTRSGTPEWSNTPEGKMLKSQVYDLLLKAQTADDMNRIIGNESWTSCFCEECLERKTYGVQFGNGDVSAFLCDDCLNKAHELLKPSTQCEYGDCAEHYGDRAAWRDHCRGT